MSCTHQALESRLELQATEATGVGHRWSRKPQAHVTSSAEQLKLQVQKSGSSFCVKKQLLCKDAENLVPRAG